MKKHLASFEGHEIRGSDDQKPEKWWREWPLALAVASLTLALLGKTWIATARISCCCLIGDPDAPYGFDWPIGAGSDLI